MVLLDNNEIIQTSSKILSNKKIEWGIKRGKNHEQPDLGSKNKSIIEKTTNILETIKTNQEDNRYNKLYQEALSKIEYK